MLSSLKKFLSDLTGDAPARFDDDDYRVAAAALLVHAITIDGEASAPEYRKLRELIETRFDLNPAAAAELITESTAADNEAVDLYTFTSLINRACDDEGRRRIIEMMWEVVLADRRIDEFEDNLLWRVGDLLNVSSRERIEIRQRVAAGQDPATGGRGDDPVNNG